MTSTSTDRTIHLPAITKGEVSHFCLSLLKVEVMSRTSEDRDAILAAAIGFASDPSSVLPPCTSHYSA